MIYFLKNFIYLLFFSISINIIGWIFISKLRLKMSNKDKYIDLFIQQITGMIIVISMYSAIITKLSTINIFFILFTIYFLLRSQTIIDTKYITPYAILKKIYLSSYIIIIISIPIYLLLVFQNFNTDFKLLFPNVDNWFYAQQASNMFLLGKETTFSLGQVFTNEHYNSNPYHYFDLWLISCLSKFTNTPSIISLLLNLNTFLST